jgi:hypothetical protein
LTKSNVITRIVIACTIIESVKNFLCIHKTTSSNEFVHTLTAQRKRYGLLSKVFFMVSNPVPDSSTLIISCYFNSLNLAL